jgi:putative DNA primase/helicase
VVDSAKRGAFHAINATEQPQEVIIAEGLATTLSVHLMRPDALAVCAIDAGNLLPVARQMRQQYPQAQIIIAADNDWHATNWKPKPMVTERARQPEQPADGSGPVALRQTQGRLERLPPAKRAGSRYGCV